MNGFETYLMGYGAPVMQPRYDEFAEGKLDTNHIVVLMQDLIEAGLLSALPQDVFVLASHCVANGLCHVTSRAVH